MSYDELSHRFDFEKSDIDDILYNYPDEFTKTSPDNIACVDTTVTKNINASVYPLLESYLRLKLRNNQKISIDTLGKRGAQFGDVRNFFMMDTVYGFLSQPCNKGKYNIDVVNDMTLISGQ